MKNVVKKGLALSMTAAMLCSMSVSAEGEYKDTLVWGQDRRRHLWILIRKDW